MAPDAPDSHRRDLLRRIPKVDQLVERLRHNGDAVAAAAPLPLLVRCVRGVLEDLRDRILTAPSAPEPALVALDRVAARVRAELAEALAPNLRHTINGTGVVVHTNLGRSLLAAEALANLQTIAGRYSNLEFDLGAGRRGSRYRAVEDLLCELSGAEAALVVNNNAGAVLLSLDTLARDRTVVVSRGELVEIGGSFRIPDVMAKSGAVLREVGTTNRTHLKDYAAAIDETTGLLLRVHTSNYQVVGFTAAVATADLAALGGAHGIPLMVDLGSGTFVDLAAFGLAREPTVPETVASGADVITFSGDKLLGGPQAGIVVGRSAVVRRMQHNPLTRALRIDKLTLAALEATLRLYREPGRAVDALPTLRMLTSAPEVLDRRARRLVRRLRGIGDDRLTVGRRRCPSRVGGGALPLQELPSQCVTVAVAGLSAAAVQRRLRALRPPLIGRIEGDRFTLDVRTLQDDELPTIAALLATLVKGT